MCVLDSGYVNLLLLRSLNSKVSPKVHVIFYANSIYGVGEAGI